MRILIYSASTTLVMISAVGCQMVSPATSQSLSGSNQASDASGVVARDDDTFAGRVATGTRGLTESVSAPFDPTYWQQREQQRQVEKRQKQVAASAKKRAAGKRSGLTAWLFPEPKKPQTLSQWLAQDRPTGDS